MDCGGNDMADYRLTKIVVEVLSDGPYNPQGLNQLAYDIVDGACIGDWDIKSSTKLTKAQAIKTLETMGSEESFLECLGNSGE